MVLHIPKKATQGRAMLVWTVEGSGSSGRAEVTVG